MKSRSSRDFEDFIRRDLEREIAHHERLAKKQQAQKPPAPQPSSHFLSQVPDKSLTWLWPGRIPLGHLTLLDAAPGSGLSLLALSLAASVSTGPASPLLLAAHSRLLLAPDPTGDSQQLLLTTKHAFCTQPDILAYTIVASETGIPTLHWLGEWDHAQLTRLCTGPLRSPYRQAILHFLQHSDTPRSIPDILEATSYDREAGRKMLLRMKMAGELVSPARGLYTTAHHPCLLNFTEPPSPVPTIPNVARVASLSPPPAPVIPVPDPHRITGWQVGMRRFSS